MRPERECRKERPKRGGEEETIIFSAEEGGNDLLSGANKGRHRDLAQKEAFACS